MTESLARSEKILTQQRTTTGTLSLGNQDTVLGVNGQALNEAALPPKSVGNIPTFIIWSVFNLIFVPFGILCCYFSRKVKHLKLQTRYDQARKWSKRTFVLNLITTTLMIGIVITITMLHYDYVQQHRDLGSNQTQTTAYIAWQPGR